MIESIIEYYTFYNEPLNTLDPPVVAQIKFGEMEKNTILVEKDGCLRWKKMSHEKLLHDFTILVGMKVSNLIQSLKESNPSIELIDKNFECIVGIRRNAE